MKSQIMANIRLYSISLEGDFDLVKTFTAKFLDGKNYGALKIDKSSPEMPFIKAAAERWLKMCEQGKVVAPLPADEELLLPYWSLFFTDRKIALELN